MATRKRTHASSDGSVSQPQMPMLAVLSDDAQLIETVGTAAAVGWSVVKPGIAQISSLIREPNLKLVIFDDASVASADRGWALTEIRRCASKALIIYVASDHDYDNEKLARSRGVLFYTAKPLAPNYMNLLLQRQLQMHNGNRHLANS